MKFAVVVGSHRVSSQSAKVARFVERTILQKCAGSSVYVLELGGNSLPFWDEGQWDDEDPRWKAIWAPIAGELRAADALVVVSPEWGGMAPAALKNFFLLAGSVEIGHKPALIVGVSSSRGGAYPIAELRSSSYKNNHICYIPEHVIVRDAKKVLNGDPASEDDAYIRERIGYAIGVLEAYGRALAEVRASGAVNYAKYPYGM